MIDVSAEAGWLSTTLQIQILLQMIVQVLLLLIFFLLMGPSQTSTSVIFCLELQGCWHYQSSVLTLPHLQPFMMYLFKKTKIDCLPALMSHVKGKI